ncbi:MAG: hypothetical protein U1F27_11560 [Turneriella sp.]
MAHLFRKGDTVHFAHFYIGQDNIVFAFREQLQSVLALAHSAVSYDHDPAMRETSVRIAVSSSTISRFITEYGSLCDI